METSVWQHGPDVAYVEAEERVVLLDLSLPEDEPRILSASGSTIWRAIDGTRTDREIAVATALHYGSSPDELARDVQLFLEQLAALHLIVRVA